LLASGRAGFLLRGFGYRFGRRLGLGLRLLVLGRQLAALRDDERLQLDADVGEEIDGDVVAADPLDRLVELDLPAVDADLARAPDLGGDVRRRDRAEERAGGTGLEL